MTETRASKRKPAARASEPTDKAAAVESTQVKTAQPGTPPVKPAARTMPAARSRTRKSASAAGAGALTAVSKTSTAPSHRHPSLGLAPVDMNAGHAAAADKLRADRVRISAGALESAVKADPTVRARYDEAGLRRLLRDGELLVERLGMCLASDNDRWLAEYAEWVAPIYRRRAVPLADLTGLCAGIRDAVEPMLTPDEFAIATRSLEAATAVFKSTSRIGGDRHKRNALWKWMYRGA